jgi:hypothetical protein
LRWHVDAEARVRHGVETRLRDRLLAALAQPKVPALTRSSASSISAGGLVALQELEAELLREALRADVGRVVDRQPVAVGREGVGLESLMSPDISRRSWVRALCRTPDPGVELLVYASRDAVASVLGGAGAYR